MAETPDDRALEQINHLLDTIRLNLSNVRNTWGEASPQYASARTIMETALRENLARLGMDVGGGKGGKGGESLEQLMAGLDLGDQSGEGKR